MWSLGGLLILTSPCTIVLRSVKTKEECMVSIMNKDVKDCPKFRYFSPFMTFKMTTCNSYNKSISKLFCNQVLDIGCFQNRCV